MVETQKRIAILQGGKIDAKKAKDLEDLESKWKSHTVELQKAHNLVLEKWAAVVADMQQKNRQELRDLEKKHAQILLEV